MKSSSHVLGLSTPVLVTSRAATQFVNDTEAVILRPGASKRAETRPRPATGSVSTLKAPMANPTCNAGPWLMVETSDGLVECTEVSARGEARRKSAYRAIKATRLWMVRPGAVWLQRQCPNIGSTRANILARRRANLTPYTVRQEA